MATYNGSAFVIRQLDSILRQLSANDEIIIVDDGSTDQTKALIEGLHDSRICLYVNQTNIGPIKSFERALTLAKGEIIFL